MNQCRSESFQQTDEEALIYSVRTANGVYSQLPNLAAGTVFWRAVSEPGSELVLGVGAVTSTWTVVPMILNNLAVWSATSPSSQANNCRLEYRTLATGAVAWTVPTNDPCSTSGQEGSGTFSPDPVRANPVTAATASGQSMRSRLSALSAALRRALH